VTSTDDGDDSNATGGQRVRRRESAETIRTDAVSERARETTDADRGGRSRRDRLQRSLGNQTVQRLAADGDHGRSAAVGGTDDRFEREARRVAEAAVRPGGREDVDPGSARSDGRRLCTRCQRRRANGKPLHCPECLAALGDARGGGSEPSGEAPVPQRAAVDTGGSTPSGPAEPTAGVGTESGGRRTSAEGGRSGDTGTIATGGGRALPDSVRTTLERRLGYDFGDVRVHTGAGADALARDLDAVAFTVGRDVFFRAGAYDPSTVAGRRLLAHELTHVVQQGESEPLADRSSDRSEPSRTRPSTPRVTHGEDATVRRQVVGFGLTPGSLLGQTWLGLGRSMKRRLVDTAIDAALTTIETFPGRTLLGGLWTFVGPGLRGFYQRLQSANPEKKVTAVDKLARIMAGESLAYAKGLLVGTLKGFFVDGLWGIVDAIRMVINGVGKLWEFLGAVRDLVGAFPKKVQKLFDTARQLGATLAANVGPAVREIENLLTDPEAVATLIGPIVEAGKAKAADLGSTVAGKLLEFFTKPGAEATVGRATGRVIGVVLFEALFAYLTAGTGTAVTAIKAVGKTIAKRAGRLAGSVLRVFRALLPYFDDVIDVVKAAGKFLKGRVLGTVTDQFAELLDTLEDLFQQFLKHCHESKLTCDFPEEAGAASKADEAGDAASAAPRRGARDTPERERRPERGSGEPDGPSRVPTGELTESARTWVDDLGLTDTARTIADAPDHVRGAINRFHGRKGFDDAVEQYLTGPKNVADGQEFVLKFAYREAPASADIAFERLTKRQIRLDESLEAALEAAESRAGDRVTDVVIDGTRYEMKSHEFGMREFLDEMNVEKYIKQLEEDLSTRPHLLRRPEKLDVRWVFDGRKTGHSGGELADRIADAWTAKLKREAREQFASRGAKTTGPSLREVERRIDADARTIRRTLQTIIEVY